MKKVYLVVFIVCSFLSLGLKSYEYDFSIVPLADAVIICWPEPERTMIPPRRDVPEEYQASFEKAASVADIPPGVLESIAFAESRFLATAKSPQRDDGYEDLGMFQFNTQYLDWYSEHYNSGYPFDPVNPAEAVIVAAKHIKFLYERYNHWPTVCLAYNAGIGAVDRDEIPDSSYQYLVKVYQGGDYGPVCE